MKVTADDVWDVMVMTLDRRSWSYETADVLLRAGVVDGSVHDNSVVLVCCLLFTVRRSTSLLSERVDRQS